MGEANSDTEIAGRPHIFAFPFLVPCSGNPETGKFPVIANGLESGFGLMKVPPSLPVEHKSPPIALFIAGPDLHGCWDEVRRGGVEK